MQKLIIIVAAATLLLGSVRADEQKEKEKSTNDVSIAPRVVIVEKIKELIKY